MIKELLKALEEQHGKKLDPNNESYYLFVKDGVIRYSVEDDEDEPGKKSVKFDVSISDDGAVKHYEDLSISIVELMKIGGL